MTRTQRGAICALGWLGCALAACSGDGKRDVTVGVRPDDHGATGASGHSGASVDAGAGKGSGGSGSTAVDNALSVQVQDIRMMTIEIVTLACAGDCADVEAVVHGGNAPYAFAWEDGSTSALRHVCLDADAALHVSATDTAIVADEFSYDAHTATAAVTASVLDCTDAGTPPPTGDFCIENPSLEGTPGVAELGGFQLPGWTTCMLSPNVEPNGGTGATLAASDGATYLGALDAIQDVLNESAGVAFCAPLEAARAISFSVDISITTLNPGAVKMELWGGSTSCAKEELLWTSPVVDEPDVWQTFCGTITPSKSYAYLVTWPVLASDDAKGSYVSLDNFRPRPSCD